MINFNRKSIAFKLSVVMLSVIFIQIFLMTVGILLSDVTTTLKNNSYNLFDSTVENRKDYLENEMNIQLRNIATYATEIEDAYNESMPQNHVITEENTTPYLIEIAPTLISILRSTHATGSFIILNDNGASDIHSSIYFIDEDPFFNNEFDEDITLLKGPTEVSRQLEIQLHNKWNYGLTITETNRDIYDMPLCAANHTDDITMSGYWGVSPSMSSNNTSNITYSIPLTDSNGDTFGVLGIEIDQDLLYTMLPNNELYTSSSLGYMIAIYDDNTKQLMPMILNGSVQNAHINDSIPLELNALDESNNMFKIQNNKEDISIVCSVQPLKLYNNNTPFDHEQWVLIAMAEQSNLLHFSEHFTHKLTIIMLLSIITCTFLTFLVGNHFAKPIVDLAKKVRTNDPKTIVALGRTGFSEIDDLSISIEGLNTKILDAILKTDKIIDMVNLPLGTFEYKKDNLSITCSDMTLQLLDLDDANEPHHMPTSDTFFNKIDHIKTNIEDIQNNIYMAGVHPSKWLKIVSVENNDTILGIIMDVTSEVLDRHAIQFERDYDSLTSLYNRYAFYRKAEIILQQGIESTTACVMFDLDNLKYINDTYGHDIGDLYIKLTADILSNQLSKNAIVARMSGDEFYVLLYNFESKDAIRNYLSTVYTAFDTDKLLLPNGKKIKIRMSGGIAWYGEDSCHLDDLIRFSDFAMYQGKHSVKGEIQEFNRTTYENESFMLSGREELNTILDNQLVDFAFQPIVSAKTGKLYAYESLMRPQSDVLSTPIKLIQLATAQSQLWKVEKVTFFKSLALYKNYANLFNNCKIFINSIPNECLNTAEVAELEHLYSNILGNIVIEITENEKLDLNTLSVKREFAKKWGGKIALDDYGSGYNGDVSLITIAPQIVKIDILMIKGIENDRNRQSIVQKLLLYAEEQNIIILAEGVETYAELEYLTNAGVDLFQGYYISRPMLIPNFDSTIIEKEITDIHNRFNPSKLQ